MARDTPVDSSSDQLPERNQRQTTDGILHRRSYLKLAGSAAGLVAGTGTAAAAADVDPDVNIVDAGADNSGNTSINHVLESVHGNGTTIYFPPGEYRLDSFHNGADDWTWYGEDARFVVPSHVTEKYLHLTGNGWTIDGIDIDLSADGAAPVNFLHGGNWTFRNVEFVGRMSDPSNRGSSSLLYMDADRGTQGLVENVRAMDGSAAVDESSNRGGLRIVGSEGDLTLRNVAVSGFANNSMYFHNMPGHLLIDNCYLEDTNTGIRIGGNTTVRDTVFNQSQAPPARWSGASAARGIWINSNSSTSGDITIEGCEFVMTDPSGAHAIYTSNSHEGIEVRDCVIRQDSDFYAVQLTEGGSGQTIIENVSITGDSSKAGIYLSGRSGARLRSLCLQKAGDGVRVRNSSDVRVENSTINVTGNPVSGSPTTSGISNSGTCPVPDGDWAPEETNDKDSGNDDEREEATEPDGTPIRLEGEAEYRIAVSGDIQPAPEIAQWVTEGEQYGDSEVDWYLTGSWTEWYFTGEIEAFDLENVEELTVYLDGEEVDPDALGASDDAESTEKTLRLEGECDYLIEVSGDIRPDEKIAQWVTEGEQYGDGQVDWYLTGSWTEWHYTGEIETFEVDSTDDLRVFVDGEAVDPYSLAASSGTDTESVLRLEGTTDYFVEVSGDIRPDEEIAQWVTEGEQYGDGKVDWYLTESWTQWYFTGDIETFEVNSTDDLRIFVDGIEVNTNSL
ncbi:right-handed parallel beta-helix repeat-containing protein [Natronosalvus rutilus]|uniref:Right-handed parallel beta-helix repeat-containing protein n=1 Tax=Natronosalvus rutilus TaxID=2953753 RepID=A0A9E7SSU1_9EURY|nr:right-handed parallel beta-helix repeat-containing protein [Natronosalvus rutilus]UTF52959.1 right-handed parallel beta-helix repeat-containing protein [Natronosalvus rutilus]